MSQENIKKQLQKVRASYLASFKDKINSIEELWQELQINWQPQLYEELYIIVHSLAGSAGTFDLPDITDSARAIVDMFKENKTSVNKPDEALLNKIDLKFNYLLKTMEQAK